MAHDGQGDGAATGMMPRFVHLRLHTRYSLLEGALRIGDLPALCARDGMPALAITDSGNLYGALEFSHTMASAGVQPIMGCTLPVFTGAALAGGGERSGGRGAHCSARHGRRRLAATHGAVGSPF